jgi:hypothetical protein
MWVQYYDVITDGASGFRAAFFGLIFFLIGILMFIVGFKGRNKIAPINEKSENNAGSLLFSGLVIMLFSSFLILDIYFSPKNKYEEFTKVIHNNLYKIIEGRVENFIAQTKEPQQTKEKFTIKGIPFEYSSYHNSVSYHKPKHKGGIIDSGKYVRIHYYEGRILRLWVLEENEK